MNHIDKDTPVWQLTLGELIYSIKESLPSQYSSSDNIPSEDKIDNKDHITGLKNLAKFLGISYSHTWRLKKKGVFDKAITQRDRTIFINKQKIMELLAEEKSK